MALPDYPGLKNDISHLLMRLLRKASDQRLGPFGESPRILYREGDASDFSTVDGDIKNIEMQVYQIDKSLTLTDLAHMTHEQILKEVVEQGQEFGDQMAKSFWEHLNETLEAVGNVVNAGGQPVDADLLFQMFETIQLGFDDRGNVQIPQVVTGDAERAESIRRIMDDPEFGNRLERLIDQRREEWLARESDRKLVD